jgi:cell pole-organizing protein PopZ
MSTNVVIDEVLEALELATEGMSSYVKASTGEVITVTDEDLQLAERFSASRPRESARTELLGAIRGSGAFRNFKGAIRRLGVEQEWLSYRRRALEELAREWLARHGLSPSTKAAQPDFAG